MNGISRINFKPHQPLYLSSQDSKPLGFGASYHEDENGASIYEGVSSKNNAGNPEPLSFEKQVLANQQKMLTLLQNIDINTTKSLKLRHKPIF